MTSLRENRTPISPATRVFKLFEIRSQILMFVRSYFRDEARKRFSSLFHDRVQESESIAGRYTFVNLPITQHGPREKKYRLEYLHPDSFSPLAAHYVVLSRMVKFDGSNDIYSLDAARNLWRKC